MALAIICWLNVDYCFTIMSFDCLVYYLIFEWWLKPSVLFNKTYFIHVTTSVSHRLNIKCMLFNIRVFFLATLFIQLYVKGDILLTCVIHLHGRISLLSGSWAHETTFHYNASRLYQYKKVMYIILGDKGCVGSHVYNTGY